MPLAKNEPTYKFQSEAPGLSADTFQVYRFEGHESISRPYEFQIVLASKQDFDPREVMENPATFTIHDSQGNSRPFHGILRQLDETHQRHGFIFYRAVLVPKIYLLTVSTRLRIFVDLSIRDIFKTILEKEGLAENLDFEFRLQNDYPKWNSSPNTARPPSIS